MAEWLAHPNEFGTAPMSVAYRRTLRATLVGGGKTKVHLVDYEMPDGTKGLGFVGPAVWSFCEPDTGLADEADVLEAYLGLVFVLAGIENGSLETDFLSENGQDEALVSMLTSKGYSDVTIRDGYRLGELEVYEFSAVRDGKRFRGAGNKDYTIGHPEDSPLFKLPQIYVFFGKMGD